jgi:cytoplasmic iron level regulating protein YaaA (DUF328/UPF0246 family)
VLILLPPSEGKTAPVVGSPVNLSSLSAPELNPVRKRVGDALVAASARRNAFEVLHVGPGLAHEVARNTSLWTNPAAIAASVYTGVLYDAARASEWSGETLARAAERVRIISALWGVLSPEDAIPAYRLSMGTTLGRLGPLGSLWRQKLGQSLSAAASDGIVVDCRSSAYAAVWKPRDPASLLQVRVERELNGKRAVVSHHAKHTRGLLTGALVESVSAPTTPEQVADVATRLDAVRSVELTPGWLTLVLGD